MAIKGKTLELASEKDRDDKKVKLPEDEQIGLSEVEIKEQLGHMTVQLLSANKTIIHLRKVIADLRKG